MFTAKYTITNRILKSIGMIDASREMVESMPLIPGWEIRLKKEALEKTVHQSISLDGNPLSMEDVKDILDGKEVNRTDLEVQEANNYKNALKFIDHITSQIGTGQSYILTLDTIMEFHHQLVNKIIDQSQAGFFRMRQVVLKNSKTGEVSYLPPPAAEVPYLMEDLINWINSEQSRDLHPVIKAGIIHFEFSRIHPYTVGNGGVARLVSLLVLFLEGYRLRGFVSIDEYFATDAYLYFHILQSVFNQRVVDSHERDLTPWLEYYCAGVAIEFNKTKERVKRVSSEAHVKDKLGDEVTLNERQMIIMEYLHRHKQMKNSDFRKIFPEHSDDTVLRELRALKKMGLINKEGGTKKAVYVIK